MHVSNAALQQFLVDAGIISPDVVRDVAASLSGSETLGDALVRTNSISPDELMRVYAHILGIPFISLTDHMCDTAVLPHIPEPLARRAGTVAFALSGDVVCVASADIAGMQAGVAAVQEQGVRVRPYVTDRASVQTALRKYQKHLKDAYGDNIRHAAKHIENTTLDATDVAESYTALLDALLAHALAQQATDVHISMTPQGTRIQYRMYGQLHEAMILSKAAGDALTHAITHAGGTESAPRAEGQFVADAGNEAVSVRFSLLPTQIGAYITLRIAHEPAHGFSLAGLGVAGADLEVLHRALCARSGLILVSGLHGSGVTTTLYTMLDVLKSPTRSIATVEDPVEYSLSGVQQIPADSGDAESMARHIRTLSRNDTDIIMVGDIRNSSTAHAALSAAASGRLVIAGIAADTAADAVAAFASYGVDTQVFARALRAVSNQRLLKRRHDPTDTKTHTCELPESVDMNRVHTAAHAAGVHVPEHTADGMRCAAPVPSDAHPDGYYGRVGIFETIPNSEPLTELLTRSTAAADITAFVRGAGMHTCIEDGVVKALRGITTGEEVNRAAREFSA